MGLDWWWVTHQFSFSYWIFADWQIKSIFYKSSDSGIHSKHHGRDHLHTEYTQRSRTSINFSLTLIDNLWSGRHGLFLCLCVHAWCALSCPASQARLVPLSSNCDLFADRRHLCFTFYQFPGVISFPTCIFFGPLFRSATILTEKIRPMPFGCRSLPKSACSLDGPCDFLSCRFLAQ